MQFLHKGEYNYTEKVLLVHFISMQLNFPVLAMFSCAAPQNAGFYGSQNAGLAIFIFLGNRIFSKRMVPPNIFTTGYIITTFCVYRQHKRKMDNFCMHWINC